MKTSMAERPIDNQNTDHNIRLTMVVLFPYILWMGQFSKWDTGVISFILDPREHFSKMNGNGLHITGMYNASSNGIGNATSEVTNGLSSFGSIWAIWFCLMIDVLPFVLWGKHTLTYAY